MKWNEMLKWNFDKFSIDSIWLISANSSWIFVRISPFFWKSQNLSRVLQDFTKKYIFFRKIGANLRNFWKYWIQIEWFNLVLTEVHSIQGTPEIWATVRHAAPGRTKQNNLIEYTSDRITYKIRNAFTQIAFLMFFWEK